MSVSPLLLHIHLRPITFEYAFLKTYLDVNPLNFKLLSGLVQTTFWISGLFWTFLDLFRT